MLIEFSVTNFRSYKEKQTLSFLPSNKVKTRAADLLVSEQYKDLRLLPNIVMYGANNTGKSNFLKALKALEWMILSSGKFNSNDVLKSNEYFIFNSTSKNQPTTFEIDFIAPNKKRYIYSVSFTRTEILQEELYFYNVSPKGKETINTLYIRERQNIKFPALKGKKDFTFEPNQLFLSRADNEGNQELKEIFSFFSEELFIFQFTETEYTDFLTKAYARYIAENKGNNPFHEVIKSILKEADTGIVNLEIIDLTNHVEISDKLPQEAKDKLLENLKYHLLVQQKFYDGKDENGVQAIPLEEQSTGTKKLLGILPIILVALKNGQTLLIDELNTSMHTHLTSLIIDWFNDSATNPNNAQLVITSHDIELINKDLYERDQIYVTEKNKFGATEMYSFADITGIRPNQRLDDFYTTGRLGGTPRLSTAYLQHLVTDFITNAEAN